MYEPFFGAINIFVMCKKWKIKYCIAGDAKFNSGYKRVVLAKVSENTKGAAATGLLPLDLSTKPTVNLMTANPTANRPAENPTEAVSTSVTPKMESTESTTAVNIL